MQVGVSQGLILEVLLRRESIVEVVANDVDG